MIRMILPRDAYTRLNPPGTARYLLGKTLCVKGQNGDLVAGLICETEAYGGTEDAACHGHMNRHTKRTAIMFGMGGFAYVYLCYGIHRMFNIVTGPAGSPEAVLIRAVKITDGQNLVKHRRLGIKESQWADGPGKVCTAMDIQLMHYGCDLTIGEPIWVEDRGAVVDSKRITITPRIGIDYAGPHWANMPWRFVWSP